MTHTIFLNLLVFLLISITSAFGAAVPKWCPKKPRYEYQVRGYELRDRIYDNKNKTVFIGSSSFRLWDNFSRDFAGHRVINRGIGGAVICDILMHRDRILTKYKPKKVFLYIGENDIAGNMTPQNFIKRFRFLLKTLKRELPNTKFYFVSMKPSPLRRRFFNQFKRGNTLVKRMSDGKLLTYIDVFNEMLDSNGSVRNDIWKADRLHMNQSGYDLWIPKIKPHL